LPRFRYDQLMRLGWRKLLPASVVNILATGLVVLAVQSAGSGAVGPMRILADVCTAVIALAGLGGAIWLAAFLLKPVEKKKMLASSSAQFAEAAGGTKTARMGA
jgi:NADH-quinone oxidoreductase subunit H